MTQQDLIFGRKCRCEFGTFSVGTTATQFLSPSFHRVGLVISAPSSGNITFSNKSEVAAGAGIQITSTTPVQDFNIVEHGDLLQKGLYVIGSGSSITFGYCEIIYCEDY